MRIRVGILTISLNKLSLPIVLGQRASGQFSKQHTSTSSETIVRVHQSSGPTDLGPLESVNIHVFSGGDGRVKAPCLRVFRVPVSGNVKENNSRERLAFWKCMAHGVDQTFYSGPNIRRGFQDFSANFKDFTIFGLNLTWLRGNFQMHPRTQHAPEALELKQTNTRNRHSTLKGGGYIVDHNR